MNFHHNIIKENKDSYTRKVLFEKKRKRFEYEAGYIFAPYIPMYNTSIIVDDFTPSKKVTSRYAKIQVNHNLYGVVSF